MPIIIQIRPINNQHPCRTMAFLYWALLLVFSVYDHQTATAFTMPSFYSYAPSSKLSSPLFSSTQSFDEKSYETDRLTKDADAMDEMKKVATDEYAKLRTPWKWRIR